jgi:hypothetical protein
MHFMGVYLMGMYLMGLYFIGMYLMGTYLMGMHLMGVYLISCTTRCSRFYLVVLRSCSFWWSVAWYRISPFGKLALGPIAPGRLGDYKDLLPPRSRPSLHSTLYPPR